MNSMDPKVCHKHSEMWNNTDVSEEHAKAILLDLCHPDDGGILFSFETSMLVLDGVETQ